MADFVTTPALRDALRVKYPAEAWALCWEVGNATGFSTNRHADAIAMGLWPSRGLHLHGFELKASRSDWLKELRSPNKAEPIARFCHYWSLVVSDASIVREGELPELWGMLAWQKNGLRIVKEPARRSPDAISLEFLAALLRSAAKPAVELDRQRLREEYARGVNDAKERSDKEVRKAAEQLAELQTKIREFEKASGIELLGFGGYGGWNRWGSNPERVGRVVQEVLAGQHNRDYDDLETIRRLAASIVARIDTSGIRRPEDDSEEGE